MMTWTEARIALLQRLWAKGVSAAGVAQALSADGGEEVSRSAVLGKLHRLGLLKSRKPASAPRRIGDASEPELDDAPLAAAFLLKRPPRSRPPLSPWKASAFWPLVGAAPRPWLTRGLGECAFPVGGDGQETLSCCAPRQRRSAYCAHHHGLMFYAAPPLRPPVEAGENVASAAWRAA